MSQNNGVTQNNSGQMQNIQNQQQNGAAGGTTPSLSASPVPSGIPENMVELMGDFRDVMRHQNISAAIRDLPKYCGLEHESFEDHLDGYKRIVSTLRLTETETIENFSQTLAGKASQQFKYGVKQESRRSWQTMQDAAREALMPPLTAEHADALFSNCKMKDNTLDDYILQLERYAYIAWKDENLDDPATAAVLEKMKLRTFLRGLRSDLRARVPAGTKSFKEAVRKAREAEGICPGENVPSFLEGNGASSSSANADQNQALQFVLKSLMEMKVVKEDNSQKHVHFSEDKNHNRSRSNSGNRNFDQRSRSPSVGRYNNGARSDFLGGQRDLRGQNFERTRSCYNCGGTDHLVANCYRSQNSDRSYQPRGYSGQSSSGQSFRGYNNRSQNNNATQNFNNFRGDRRQSQSFGGKYPNFGNWSRDPSIPQNVRSGNQSGARGGGTQSYIPPALRHPHGARFANAVQNDEIADSNNANNDFEIASLKEQLATKDSELQNYKQLLREKQGSDDVRNTNHAFSVHSTSDFDVSDSDNSHQLHYDPEYQTVTDTMYQLETDYTEFDNDIYDYSAQNVQNYVLETFSEQTFHSPSENAMPELQENCTCADGVSSENEQNFPEFCDHLVLEMARLQKELDDWAGYLKEEKDYPHPCDNICKKECQPKKKRGEKFLAMNNGNFPVHIPEEFSDCVFCHMKVCTGERHLESLESQYELTFAQKASLCKSPVNSITIIDHMLIECLLSSNERRQFDFAPYLQVTRPLPQLTFPQSVRYLLPEFYKHISRIYDQELKTTPAETGTKSADINQKEHPPGSNLQPSMPLSWFHGFQLSPGKNIQQGGSFGCFNIVWMVLLFLTAFQMPTVAGSDIFTSKMSKVNSLVMPDWGLAMTPMGLSVTARNTEFIPLIIQLALPPIPVEWAPIGWTPECGWNTKDCDKLPKLKLERNESCLHAHSLEQTVSKITSKFRQRYSGILNTGFYIRFLDSFCQSSPTLCSPPKPPNGTTTKREKRFIGLALAGVFGLGGLANSVRNSIHMDQIDSKVAAISEGFQQLLTKEEVNQRVIEKLTSADERAYHFIHESIHNVVDLVSSVRCESLQYTKFLHEELVLHIFSEALEKSISSVMSSALRGHVSPDLIDLTVLSKIIDKNAGLKNSILSKEPSLVYQFGRVYPVRLDLSSLQFGFILEVPVPLRKEVRPIFAIKNVGYNVPSTEQTIQVSMPDYVVQSIDGHFSEIDVSVCSNVPGLWFCPPNSLARTLRSTCVSALLSNSSAEDWQKCRAIAKVKSLTNDTIYLSTTEGILIRTNKSEVIVSRSTGISHVSDGMAKPVPAHGVLWFGHGSYTHIVVGHLILTSALQSEKHIIRLPTLWDKFEPPLLNIVPVQYTELNVAERENSQARAMIKQAMKEHVVLPVVPIEIKHGLLIVVILFIIGIAIVVWVSGCGRKYRRRCRRRFRSRRRGDDDDNSSGDDPPNRPNRTDSPSNERSIRKPKARWVKTDYKMVSRDEIELTTRKAGKSRQHSQNETLLCSADNSPLLPPDTDFIGQASTSQQPSGKPDQRGSQQQQGPLTRRQNKQLGSFVYSVSMTPLILAFTVLGIAAEALLDTGANINLMHTEFAKKLENIPIWPANSMSKSTAANGETIKIDYMTTVEMNFKDGSGRVKPMTFHVTPTCPHDIVLGTQFIQTMGDRVDIDLRTNTVGFPNLTNKRISFVKPVALNPTPFRVSAITTTEVKPYQRRMVNAMVETPQQMFCNAVFEQADEGLLKAKVTTESSLVNISRRHIPVCITNNSPEAIMVYENQTLGTATVQDPEQEKQVNYVKSATGEILRFPPQANNSQETPSNNDTTAHAEKFEDLPEAMQKITVAKENITAEQYSDTIKFLDQNKQVFSQHAYDLGRCKVFEATINTGNAAPIYSPPYRLPVHHREPLLKELRELLQRGIIEPSNSPWASPMLYVPKANGQWRLVVDFRKINKVCEGDVYPIPRIDDTLTALKGAKLFSIFDMNKGFWNLPLCETDGSRERSSFNTWYGQFQHTCLPQGLKSSSGNFQRCLEKVLGDLQWTGGLIIYIDDLLVFSSTYEEHIKTLTEIFKRLKAADLKISPAKSKMFQTSVTYLGHLISPEGICPLKKRVEAIDEFPTPKNVKEIERFLGMCAYYSKFIKAFSSLAAPLNALKKKATKFVWSENCEKSFCELKKRLTQAPVLAHPDMKKPFILHTDASNIGLGCVLSQIGDDGKEHPVGYAAKAVNRHQRNYATHDLECLAIKFGIEHFRHFLYGGPPFQVVTDNVALKWLMTSPPKNSRIARWRLEFAEYDFTIKHRPGKQNANADTLSRNPLFADLAGEKSDSPLPNTRVISPVINMTEAGELLDCINDYLTSPAKGPSKSHTVCAVQQSKPTLAPTNTGTTNAGDVSPDFEGFSPMPDCQTPPPSTPMLQLENTVSDNNAMSGALWNDIQALQERDGFLGPLILYLRDGKVPDQQDMAIKMMAISDDFVFEDDLLYRITKRRKESARQLAVPEPLRKHVLLACHESLYAGHMGQNKTHYRVSEKYWWPSLWSSVRNWIKTCEKCTTRKNPSKHAKALLRPIPAVDPLHRMHVDILDLKVESTSGHRYVITFVDAFSKYVIAKCTRDQTADTVARLYVQDVLLKLGAVRTLISDCGLQFTCDLNKEIMMLTNTKKVETTIFHPAGNSQVERWHRTLLDSLSLLVDQGHKDWNEMVPFCEFAYNTSVNASTGDTPFYLLHGWDCTLPNSAELKLGADRTHGQPEYKAQTAERIRLAWQLAADNIKSAQVVQKRNFDRDAKDPAYMAGDLVMLNLPSLHQEGGSHKLDHKWCGPYRVIDIEPPNAFIQMANNRQAKIERIHFNRLKPASYPRVMPFVEEDPLTFHDPADINLEREKEDNSPTTERITEYITDAKKRRFIPPNAEWQMLKAGQTRLPFEKQAFEVLPRSTELGKPRTYLVAEADSLSCFQALSLTIVGKETKWNLVSEKLINFGQQHLKQRWGEVFGNQFSQDIVKNPRTNMDKILLLSAAWLKTQIFIFRDVSKNPSVRKYGWKVYSPQTLGTADPTDHGRAIYFHELDSNKFRVVETVFPPRSKR